MNLPAASHGVSMLDKFYSIAVPLNLSGTGNLTQQISQSPLHIHSNLCNLRNLWINQLVSGTCNPHYLTLNP